jgi:hypothetical protein
MDRPNRQPGRPDQPRLGQQHLMTRHQRLKRTMRSPDRAWRRTRNREARQERRLFYATWRALCAADDRIVPPSFIFEMVGMNLNRPQDAFVITGSGT